MPHWLRLDDATMWWVTGVSVGMFLVTAIAAPMILIYVPPDYFTRERRPLKQRLNDHPIGFGALLVGKNLLGVFLLIAGILMLVLPGQGVLTILIAAGLMDFPRKYAVERWLVTRPRVFKGVNWLRRKAGRSPLRKPG